MGEEAIRVFGTDWCGDCIRAKRVLDECGVDYEWIDIDRDREAQAYVMQVNGGLRSVPTIVFVDGSVLVEPSDSELGEKLAALA